MEVSFGDERKSKKNSKPYRIIIRRGWVKGQWEVRLVIDHQSFALDPCNCTSEKKARWVKRQLTTAMERLIRNVKDGVKLDAFWLGDGKMVGNKDA